MSKINGLEPSGQSVGAADSLAGVDKAREILSVYFAPWGAAKAARWEDISGDRTFHPEVALSLIERALTQDVASVSAATVCLGSVFCKMLRTRRGALGLSLSQAAKRIGISKAHLWDLETGRSTNPGIKLILSISETFGGAVGQWATFAAGPLPSDAQAKPSVIPGQSDQVPQQNQSLPSGDQALREAAEGLLAEIDRVDHGEPISSYPVEALRSALSTGGVG